MENCTKHIAAKIGLDIKMSEPRAPAVSVRAAISNRCSYQVHHMCGLASLTDKKSGHNLRFSNRALLNARVHTTGTGVPGILDCLDRNFMFVLWSTAVRHEGVWSCWTNNPTAGSWHVRGLASVSTTTGNHHHLLSRSVFRNWKIHVYGRAIVLILPYFPLQSVSVWLSLLQTNRCYIRYKHTRAFCTSTCLVVKTAATAFFSPFLLNNLWNKADGRTRHEPYALYGYMLCALCALCALCMHRVSILYHWPLWIACVEESNAVHRYPFGQ